MKNKDIATAVGVSGSLVSTVKKYPALRPLLKAMFDLRSRAVGNIDLRIASQLKLIATKSLDRINDMLEPLDEEGHGGTNDADLILRIARDSLDRIGFTGGRGANISGGDAADELAANAKKYEDAEQTKRASSSIKNCVDVTDPSTEPDEGDNPMRDEHAYPNAPAGAGGGQ